MFKDLIQRVGLDNYVLDGDSLTYPGNEEDFSIRQKSVIFSTHKPLEARHKFHQLCQVYPKNFFIQSFSYNLRDTPIPELSEIERSEANKIAIVKRNIKEYVPDLVEMLKAYFT